MATKVMRTAALDGQPPLEPPILYQLPEMQKRDSFVSRKLSLGSLRIAKSMMPIPEKNEDLDAAPDSGYSSKRQGSVHSHRKNNSAYSTATTMSSSHPPRTSRIQELLHNNHVATHAEFVQFSQILSNSKERLNDVSSRISAVDRQIKELQQEKIELMNEREEAWRDVHDIETIISPVRRLPTEVLEEIFLYSMDLLNARWGMISNSLDTRKAPWTSTQVCRRWRQVAIDCPLLWVHVGLSLTDRLLKSPPRSSQAAFLLGMQLSRATVNTLAVTIEVATAISPDNTILHVLRPSSVRWDTLSMSVPISAVTALSSMRGFFPLLRRLYLSAYGQPSASQPLNDVFEFAPNLRTFYSSSPSTRNFILPWHQLTDFSAMFFGIDERWTNGQILQVLAKTKGLSECELVCLADPRLRLGSPVTLEGLQSLRITQSDADAVQQLLEHLTLPVLRSLHIKGRVPDPQTLSELIQRSGCTIEVLYIHDNQMSDVECVELLESSPSLLHLVLGAASPQLVSSGRLLDKLCEMEPISEGRDLPLLVPSLRLLGVPKSASDIKDSASLKRLVRARPGLRIKFASY